MNRRIELEGCLNFRDLGGYPTEDGRSLRWRQLFRSDALHLLTPRDVRILREELRLGAIVDLRSSSELGSDGRGPLESEAIRFHHVPLFDGIDLSGERRTEALTLSDRYYLLAEFARDAIGRVVNTLAFADAPALYHCAAGKDRTGVISAVLLGLLGVRDEVIVADYALTQENLDAIVDRLMSTPGYQVMLAALPPDTLHANPETMSILLQRLRDKYGSVRAYAEVAGVTAEAIERLHARLLEERMKDEG